MIDSRIKQRVIIDGKKFYKHPVFSNYATNKNEEVINVKTGRIRKMTNCKGYLCFSIYDKNLKNQRITINIDLFLKFFKDQYHDVLKLTIKTIIRLIIESKTYNYFHINKILKKVIINQLFL